MSGCFLSAPWAGTISSRSWAAWTVLSPIGAWSTWVCGQSWWNPKPLLWPTSAQRKLRHSRKLLAKPNSKSWWAKLRFFPSIWYMVPFLKYVFLTVGPFSPVSNHFHFVFRMDEVAWVRFKAQQHKKSAREHIVAVTHKKAQNTIGNGNLAIIGAIFWHSCFNISQIVSLSKSQVQNPDSTNETEPLDVEELASSRSGLAPNSESQDRREVHGTDVCREPNPWHLECPQLGIMVPPSQFGTEGGAVNKNDLSGHKWIS